MGHVQPPDPDSTYAALQAYLDESLNTSEAQAYAEARSLDELCYAAGEYVTAHALEMARRLGLGWHGILPLRVLRLAASDRWRRYVSLRLSAFAACAVADLSALRELLTRGDRTPRDLTRTLQRVFAMACTHARAALKLTDEEKEMLLDICASHIGALTEHPDWARDTYVKRVLDLPGIDVQALGPRRTTDFVAKAMLEGTAVNAPAFLRDLDRLSGGR